MYEAEHVGLCTTCLKVEYSFFKRKLKMSALLLQMSRKIVSSFLFPSFGTCVIPECKIFHNLVKLCIMQLSQNVAVVCF